MEILESHGDFASPAGCDDRADIAYKRSGEQHSEPWITRRHHSGHDPSRKKDKRRVDGEKSHEVSHLGGTLASLSLRDDGLLGIVGDEDAGESGDRDQVGGIGEVTSYHVGELHGCPDEECGEQGRSQH